MRNTLDVLNQLEAAGLFRRHAIGGAIGAIFYMEPFETEDLDVLILLPAGASALAPLAGIFDELRRRGYREDGPYVIVEGVPVQFLVAYNPLVEEAVAQARELPYEDVMTRVPSPEHLAAIMLDTGRAKDRARFAQMCADVSLDSEKLRDIVSRHGLMERHREWTAG